MKCYTRDPEFVRFVAESGIPFQPHYHFDKVAIEARQEVYRQLCEAIWDPERFEQEIAGS